MLRVLIPDQFCAVSVLRLWNPATHSATVFCIAELMFLHHKSTLLFLLAWLNPDALQQSCCWLCLSFACKQDLMRHKLLLNALHEPELAAPSVAVSAAAAAAAASAFSPSCMLTKQAL